MNVSLEIGSLRVTKFLFSLPSNSEKSTADWKQLIQFQRKDSNAYNYAVRHFEILFSKRLNCRCHSSYLIWGWVRVTTVKCLRVFKLCLFIPTIFFFSISVMQGCGKLKIKLWASLFNVQGLRIHPNVFWQMATVSLNFPRNFQICRTF